MSTEQIYKILDLLPDPAFFWTDGSVTFCNAACARLPLHCGDTAPWLEQWPSSGMTLHQELEVGGVLWEITQSHLGEQTLVLLHPVGDEKMFHAALAAAVRSMQEPLGDMLSAGAQLFPELEEMEDELMQQQTAAMTRGLYRLVRALNAFTELPRLQSESRALCLQRTDVPAFLALLAQRASDALLDQGVKLDYQGPKNSFYGNLDTDRVLLAVANLLTNAAKYARKGSTVLLQAELVGRRLRICVHNEGKTMEPDVLATAFSRCTQVQPFPEAEWGAGVGLPLARAVARQHGGSVLLESGSGGTTVTMMLDLNLPVDDTVETPRVEVGGGYDPLLVEFSSILPNETYDSRSVDL